MNREKKFAKNTIIITIGKFCTQLITFLLLPLYTAMLSTSEYGCLELLNTLVSLLLPIMTFQVEQAVFRELIENRTKKEKIKEIVSNSFIIIILQCLIYFTIFLLLYRFINNKYKIFICLNVIAYAFSYLFLQIARGLGENKKYAAGSILGAIITMTLNILFLTIFKFKVKGVMIGILCGQLGISIYLLLSLKIYKYTGTACINKKTSKELLKYSLPLVPNQISWWVFNASDRVIVSIFLGLSMTGILSAASKFSSVYVTIYSVFNLSWIESISEHIKDDDSKEYCNKIFNILFGLFASLGIGIISFMPFVYKIMVNSNYKFGYYLVPILIIASFFHIIVSMLGSIYIANKRTREVATTSIISAFINIITHLILIRFIGLYAAVISTFVAYFTMSIVRLYDVKKKFFKINFAKKTSYITIIVLAVVTTLYYINNIFLNIISIILSIIFAYLMNYKQLKTIKKIILNKQKNRLRKKEV